MRRIITLIALATAVATLGGCAATQVAISKRDLDVQTKMSATVFLDPVKQAQRTVFVQIRNTSDQPDFDISSDIAAAISAKGYRVLTDPDAAHYIVQANVLQVGKASPSAAEVALSGGYGAPMGTGLMVAGAAYWGGTNSGQGLMGAGLVGAAAEMISGAMVKDVYYCIITDIQIKERIRQGGDQAQVHSQHRLAQGTSGGTSVSYQETSDWKMYQTRIVSTANKVNLELAEAMPALRTGLMRSLSGLF